MQSLASKHCAKIATTFFFSSKFCRDNGVKAIENLMTKRGKFDYILLETTGLADPGMMYLWYSMNQK